MTDEIQPLPCVLTLLTHTVMSYSCINKHFEKLLTPVKFCRNVSFLFSQTIGIMALVKVEWHGLTLKGQGQLWDPIITVIEMNPQLYCDLLLARSQSFLCCSISWWNFDTQNLSKSQWGEVSGRHLKISHSKSMQRSTLVRKGAVSV